MHKLIKTDCVNFASAHPMLSDSCTTGLLRNQTYIFTNNINDHNINKTLSVMQLTLTNKYCEFSARLKLAKQ